MRWILKWYAYSCKRMLKKPFFCLLLFLLPLGMWLFARAEEGSGGTISIALYTDRDPWNEAVAGELVSEGSSFEFYVSESEEALREDVAAGRAECGYCFPAGLRKKLEEGDYRRSIRMVVSPSTVTAGLASETVFAGLFRVYGRELLEQYAKEGEAFAAAREETGEIWEELEPLYDEYLENGSTFAFAYETIAGGAVKTDQAPAVFPVRGIGAVFILVMGLGAAVTAGEDESRGLFLAMETGRKRVCQLMGIGASVLFGVASVFASFAVSGTLSSFGGAEVMRELAALLVYGAACAVFGWAVLAAVQKPQVIAALIPFFVLGSLAVCPVFADLSVFVPAVKGLRWLFLPWYYLRGI